MEEEEDVEVEVAEEEDEKKEEGEQEEAEEEEGGGGGGGGGTDEIIVYRSSALNVFFVSSQPVLGVVLAVSCEEDIQHGSVHCRHLRLQSALRHCVTSVSLTGFVFMQGAVLQPQLLVYDG